MFKGSNDDKASLNLFEGASNMLLLFAYLEVDTWHRYLLTAVVNRGRPDKS